MQPCSDEDEMNAPDDFPACPKSGCPTWDQVAAAANSCVLQFCGGCNTASAPDTRRTTLCRALLEEPVAPAAGCRAGGLSLCFTIHPTNFGPKVTPHVPQHSSTPHCPQPRRALWPLPCEQQQTHLFNSPCCAHRHDIDLRWVLQLSPCRPELNVATKPQSARSGRTLSSVGL